MLDVIMDACIHMFFPSSTYSKVSVQIFNYTGYLQINAKSRVRAHSHAPKACLSYFKSCTATRWQGNSWNQILFCMVFPVAIYSEVLILAYMLSYYHVINHSMSFEEGQLKINSQKKMLTKTLFGASFFLLCSFAIFDYLRAKCRWTQAYMYLAMNFLTPSFNVCPLMAIHLLKYFCIQLCFQSPVIPFKSMCL